jgi:serine/threonine protein kinase
VNESQQSIGDFLAVLRSSGLVAPDVLEPLVAPYAAATGPVPETLIGELLARELLTQWQLDQLRKGKHKGFVLGRYKLLQLLGAGGMGSVYLGKHEVLGHKAALKILPRSHATQSSYLERFIREAQAAARLAHPNIARVVELETGGAIHFMVMEYVEGIDLNAKVKQEGPLEIVDAVDYVRQAALGLHHAHEEGFVHRDIKPANLMLDKHGMIKILDLGLAKTRADDDAASLTQEFNEKVLGTADYLAPEQAVNSHDADRRADIYALGCTLYFLLIGRAPFAKGSVKERIRAQRHDAAPNPLEERPEIPAAIAEVYFRMMEKNPDARQQTAQEVADSLKAWLGQQALASQRPRPETARRSAVRRSPGSSTRMPAVAPPGRVYRSGPGSGSGAMPRPGPVAPRPPATSRSGVDLSSLSFNTPSDSRSTAGGFPMIDVGGGTGPAKPGANAAAIRTASSTAAEPPTRRPTAGMKNIPRLRLPAWLPSLPSLASLGKREIAGLPLPFWLFVGVVVLTGIGLGVAVWQKFSR